MFLNSGIVVLGRAIKTFGCCSPEIIIAGIKHEVNFVLKLISTANINVTGVCNVLDILKDIG